ncbi:MAG TPA: fibronectin type III domain-containing protein [Streptosporangiaceae bacterium]|nr:fibronectin type III domain-containing protein [Streptosporangiaceae bacterium]
MKSLRLVPRYRPAALLALAAFGLAVTGAAVAAPAAVAAVRAPQARVLNPSPPTGLTAVAGNGQVSLSWSPPTSNGGAAIIGYDVYQGGSAASGLVGGTSYTVTGLTNGTTYSFTVDAVNGAQLHSAPSSPASATPVAPVTAPGAPSGLTAAAGDAQVSLSWQAPSADGGAAITSYNVYQGGRKAATVTGTGATVKNLSDGTTYAFTVTAVNQAGEGPASRAVSATPTAAITKPGAPNGLAASPGDRKVTLSWSPPKSTGGAAVTSYNVYQGGKRVAGVTGTGTTVTNLSDGTTYTFTVTAVNKAGEGPASGAASATPAAASASASASASGSASASASASAGASASGTASSPGAATPAGGAGASSVTAGSAGPSGQQTGAAVLASDTKKMPKPVLFTLAALALAAAGGALTLTTRRVRKGRRTKRPPAAPPVDVRAVPEIGPPSPVSVHEFTVEHHELSAENHEVVMEETYTVRLEPLPAAIITTFEEIGA